MLIKPFKPLGDIVVSPINDKKVNDVKNTIYFRNNGGANEEITSGVDYVDVVLESEMISKTKSWYRVIFVRLCYYFTGIIDYRENPSIFNKELSVVDKLKYTRLYLQQATSFGATIPIGTNNTFTVYRSSNNSISTITHKADISVFDMDRIREFGLSDFKNPPDENFVNYMYDGNIESLIKDFPYLDLNPKMVDEIKQTTRFAFSNNLAYDIVNPLYPRIVEIPSHFSDGVNKDAFVSEIATTKKIFYGEELISKLLNLNIVSIPNTTKELEKHREELRRLVMSSDFDSTNELLMLEVDLKSKLNEILYRNLTNGIQNYLKEIECIFDIEFISADKKPVIKCGVKRYVSPIHLNMKVLDSTIKPNVDIDEFMRQWHLAYNSIAVAERYREVFYTICWKVLQPNPEGLGCIGLCYFGLFKRVRVTIHDTQFDVVAKLTTFLNDGTVRSYQSRMTKNELLDDYVMHDWSSNVNTKKYRKLSMLGGH